jgi:hypothetical protein
MDVQWKAVVRPLAQKEERQGRGKSRRHDIFQPTAQNE